MAIHKTQLDTKQRDHIREEVRRMAREFGYALQEEAIEGKQWRLVKAHEGGDRTEVNDNADVPLVIYGFLLGIETASRHHD